MRRAFCILIMLLCHQAASYAQDFREIEGKVLSNATGEGIQFANMYNLSLQKGTITNTDGYFRIPVKSQNDSIVVSFVGYNNQYLHLQDEGHFYTVLLEESEHVLDMVTITPEENTYLYQLISECRKNLSNKEMTAKSYYELKSFVDSQQVELVEGYYNVDLRGQQLVDLKLKAGRLALQPNAGRFFTSLESSRAILMLHLFQQNDFFPANPLGLPKSRLRKRYDLYLDNKYMNDAGDSIYVIDYRPKDTAGRYFEGKVWINKSGSHVLKITLNCHHARIHPFLPLFSTDKITGVSFAVTQTFLDINEVSFLNHTDFLYEIDYLSRMGEPEEQQYTVKTTAVLFAYDYDQPFLLPFYTGSEYALSDYRKINAMPYNPFFWTFNDGYRLHDSTDANERFFTDTNSINNTSLFSSNSYYKKGLLEYPFVTWSPARITFRQIVPDTTAVTTEGSFAPDPFAFDVQVFLDMNTYQDSMYFLTSTLFNPYESYYHLPLDNQAYCFINIYFDLCEIERRKFDRMLRSSTWKVAQIGVMYDAFLAELKQVQQEYLNSVNRGNNMVAMTRYNELVYEQLGINNMALFPPYSGDE
jgi:hypothetical protein